MRLLETEAVVTPGSRFCSFIDQLTAALYKGEVLRLDGLENVLSRIVVLLARRGSETVMPLR